MKTKTPFFTRLISVMFFILPYLFLSSCGDTAMPVVTSSYPPAVNGDIPIASQQGMLKLLVTYNNGSAFFDYCLLMQAYSNELITLRRNVQPEVSYLPFSEVNSITVTKWAPGTFWGRIVTGLNVNDSMCCTSVRYTGGKWYLENPSDTVEAEHRPGRYIQCSEKCPF
jgi:hypothetical protein